VPFVAVVVNDGVWEAVREIVGVGEGDKLTDAVVVDVAVAVEEKDREGVLEAVGGVVAVAVAVAVSVVVPVLVRVAAPVGVEVDVAVAEGVEEDVAVGVPVDELVPVDVDVPESERLRLVEGVGVREGVGVCMKGGRNEGGVKEGAAQGAAAAASPCAVDRTHL
jgi:hypothetical protein